MREAATCSERLAGYVHDARLEHMDEATIERAKHLIAYHVGLAMRGLRTGEPDAKQAIAVARELSEGCGTSSIIGTPFRVTLVDAVMANCTLMRSYGLDDVIFPAGIHPGLVTVPVALSLAERLRSSGAEVLAAIITAYEVLGKFGSWTWSKETPRRATMPFGTFGAVVVAARLLRLNRAQTADALGYAAHTAMGLAEGDAGPITHFYAMVCRNGITGAYLAREGGWCSPTVLEGRFGFLESFLGTAQVDFDRLLASFGRNYVVHTSCEKRYPGTALNQVPVELMRQLMAEHGVRAADIREIHLDFPVERRNFASGHSTGPFPKRASATGSVAFQLGVLLLDGEMNPARYDEVDNPDILAVAQKCRIGFVEGKSIRYARLEVRMQDGRCFVREGDAFAYEQESARVILEREAQNVLPRAKIERFLRLLAELEDVDDASFLMHSLVP